MTSFTHELDKHSKKVARAAEELITAKDESQSAINNDPCYVVIEQEIYDLRPLYNPQGYHLMLQPGTNVYFNFCKFVNKDMCRGNTEDSFAQMTVF